MTVRLSALTGLGLSFALSAAVSAHAQRKATLEAALTPSEPVSFEVYLPATHKTELQRLLVAQQTPSSPQFHQWLTPAEVATRFAPAPAVVQAVENELSRFGLGVAAVSPHLLEVSGTAAEVTAALGTPLRHGTNAAGRPVVVATAPVSAPSAVVEAGGVITGLSGTVRMHSHIHVQAQPDNRYSAVGPYWFDDLKQAYVFPSYNAYAGRGATIGILISSGINQNDMNLYFGNEGLNSPKITVENVLGGAPFSPTSDGSLEAELDVQQSGGMAPKAKIVVYSIPDLSDNSLIAGLSQIVTDNKVDVVNMSFGGPELAYTAAYNGGTDYTGILTAEDEVMAEGNAEGITFVASSGDSGALSIPAPACFFTNANPCGTFEASAEFPASSPHVTGVGGTNLQTTYAGPSSLNSAYVSEEAYADPLTADIFYDTYATGGYWGSGGGDSVVFPQPLFQALVATGNPNARTVPDVAYHMGGCPADAVCNPDDSADLEVFNGQLYGVIGTSAAAPDFAGLTALNIERWGSRLGNENFYIYALAAAQAATAAGGAPSGLPYTVFHQGIPGFNGLYSSGNVGYNRVLGNGTVIGKDFLESPLLPSAGMPQTPTNP